MGLNVFLLSVLGLVATFCQPQQTVLPLRIRCPIKNYLKQDLVICSFGASVTQQKDSIWDHFVSELNQKTGRNHKHIKMGYGGNNLYATSMCRIDEVAQLKPDICIIDWFGTMDITCTDRTRMVLETLIRKLSEIDSYIIFFYHTRGNYFARHYLNFIDFVDKIGLQYNITSYYEQEAISLRPDLSLNDLLRDIVHTSPYGSAVLGTIFCDYFTQIPIMKEKIECSLPPINDFYNVQRIKISEKMIVGSYFVDKDGFFVLTKNSLLNINMRGHFLCLYEKIGPYSPIADITIDEKNFYTESVWDKWCSYERFSTATFVDRDVLKNVKISISEKLPDYAKSAKPFDYSGIEKLLKVKEFFICPNGVSYDT